MAFGLPTFIMGAVIIHCGGILIWISDMVRRILDWSMYWGMLVGCMQFMGWLLQLGVYIFPWIPCGNVWADGVIKAGSWMVPYTPTVVSPPVDNSWGWQWAAAGITSLLTGIIGTCRHGHK